MGKRGRPPLSKKEKRGALVQARVTEAELKDIQKAAALDRRKVADWVRRVAVDAAEHSKAFGDVERD